MSYNVTSLPQCRVILERLSTFCRESISKICSVKGRHANDSSTTPVAKIGSLPRVETAWLILWIEHSVVEDGQRFSGCHPRFHPNDFFLENEKEV
jgi:hypothetical protein